MTYWSSGPHGDISQTREYVRGNLSPGFPTWAITREGGKALGWVVLIPRREDVSEIGYILRRDTWGQNLGREAASRVITYGFGEQKLRRIYADVDPENLASVTLLEKLKFRREGHLRAEWKTHIGIRDSLIYGILHDEWSAGQ